MWRGGVRRDKESSSRRYASTAPFLSTHWRMPIGSPWQTVRGDGNLDFLLRRFTVGCDWHDGFGRKLPARSGLPIFDVQAAHAREFPGVVSHQDQASRPCLSGNGVVSPKPRNFRNPVNSIGWMNMSAIRLSQAILKPWKRSATEADSRELSLFRAFSGKMAISGYGKPGLRGRWTVITKHRFRESRVQAPFPAGPVICSSSSLVITTD